MSDLSDEKKKAIEAIEKSHRFILVNAEKRGEKELVTKHYYENYSFSEMMFDLTILQDLLLDLYKKNHHVGLEKK